MAYFEVFENLEGPIRINISARKSYEMESAFGEIRRMIGEKKPLADVQARIDWLKAALREVEPVLDGGHRLVAEEQHNALSRDDIAVHWQESFRTIDDLLAQAVIKGGYCVYAYSPELCEKLYRPEIYALLNLSIQRKFSSSYALALYENCLRYRRIGTTGWIGLDILKRLLGISEADGYYQDFRKFNDKVIKPAVRQVNDTSDLLLEIDYQRDHRKVAAVRFRVSDNPQMLLFAQHQAAITAPEDVPPVVDKPEDRLERQEHLRDKLAACGLSARQVRMALATHEPDYLEGNIAVVEQDLIAGKVHNLPAYLLAALREDYRPRAAAPRRMPSPEPAAADRAEETESPTVRQERSRTQFLAARLQAALDRLTPPEREALEADYVAYLEQGDGFEARLLLGLYRKSGLHSKIVESHYRAFARERLVGPLDEAEFAAYASLREGEDRQPLKEVS